MNLDELRNDIIVKQKKGLPFICASVVIWLLIVVVTMLELPQMYKNMLIFAVHAHSCLWHGGLVKL